MKKKVRWSVYIVRCADGSLYTGIALDLERRLKEHRSGRGSRYLRGRVPLRLVYQEIRLGRSSASRREAALKRLSRREKLDLLRKFIRVC